jgi:hypothetical protein
MLVCKELYSASSDRQALYTARAMADPRATLRRELERQGALRRGGLATADRALREIAALLPDALEAGITKMEIRRLTGVSRPTIDGLLRGESD